MENCKHSRNYLQPDYVQHEEAHRCTPDECEFVFFAAANMLNKHHAERVRRDIILEFLPLPMTRLEKSGKRLMRGFYVFLCVRLLARIRLRDENLFHAK